LRAFEIETDDDAFKRGAPFNSRIPAYRMLKVLFCAWMVNPRFKGAITLYKKALSPVFTQLSPSIDRTTEQLKKGDFAAIQEELGPQFAKVQELVKKHGPEAIERAMNMAGKGKKTEEAKAE
jgi:receptor expression-enhancing protein 5/6